MQKAEKVKRTMEEAEMLGEGGGRREMQMLEQEGKSDG